MENNHGLGVTPRSCHVKSLMDLAEHPRELKPVANVAIPSRQRWQSPAGNLSSAVNRFALKAVQLRMKENCTASRAVRESHGLR